MDPCWQPEPFVQRWPFASTAADRMNAGSSRYRALAYGLQPNHGSLQFLRARLAQRYLSNREIESIAKTTIFNCHPDALCVSGATAGSATNPETLRRAKSTSGTTAVFANTGCNPKSISSLLEIADGAVVGTYFKVDGRFENLMDAVRVKEFMDVVHTFRARM